MKKILIALVRFYRKYISPAFPSHCRFIPTCSQYAIEALEKYGALKGSWLTLKRLLPVTFGQKMLIIIGKGGEGVYLLHDRDDAV